MWLGVWGIGWVWVIGGGGGGGGLNFIKDIPLKTNPTKVVKKFQNLKIWPKIPIGNRQVGSRFSKNRPTCCDFEKKILDSQLHQTFKPIRILFCTASSCSDLGIYLSYNIYNFHPIWRTFLDSLHSLHSLTHFTSLTSRPALLSWVPGRKGSTRLEKWSLRLYDSHSEGLGRLSALRALGSRLRRSPRASRAKKKTFKFSWKIPYGESDTFVLFFHKIQIPIRNFFFVRATLQLVPNFKPIR